MPDPLRSPARDSVVSSTSDDVLACCSALYGHPLAELLVGDSLHPGGRAGTRDLLRSGGLKPGARLLDAGCGLGTSARLAALEFGLSVDGVDGSPTVLELARSRGAHPGIRWITADLAALPFADRSFDGVLAECVLSTTDRVAVLGELGRVTRTGGVLLMSDVEVEPNAVSALAVHPLIGAVLCVATAWEPGELASRLPEAGFIVQHRQDASAAIIELVDRVEARATLATAWARDMGLDPALLLGSASSLFPGLGGTPVEAVASSVRAAVRRGDLKYWSVAAIRAPHVAQPA